MLVCFRLFCPTSKLGAHFHEYKPLFRETSPLDSREELIDGQIGASTINPLLFHFILFSPQLDQLEKLSNLKATTFIRDTNWCNGAGSQKTKKKGEDNVTNSWMNGWMDCWRLQPPSVFNLGC